MSDQVKKKLSNIFLVILYFLAIVVLAMPGIQSMLNQKGNLKQTIIYASPMFEIEHSMNGLIPIGKEYYYMGIALEDASVVIIKNSKNWMKNNFDDSGYSLSDQGVTIQGRAKRLSAYASRMVNDCAQKMEHVQFSMGNYQCFNAQHQHYAILGVIASVLLLLLGIVWYLVFKKKANIKVSPIVLFICFFFVLIFSAYVLTVR